MRSRGIKAFNLFDRTFRENCGQIINYLNVSCD